MIVRSNYVRTLKLTHTNGTVDDITDSVFATSALDEFNHKEDIRVEEHKLVPYHAIEYAVTSLTITQEEVDNECDLACSVMPDPTLTAPTETIEVDAGDEFDPMIGVSAVDGNGREVEVTVSVEEATDGNLQTENGVDITDENSNPLIGG